MNSRERLLTALDHQEPDRIPFDLGSTQVTGIHVVAFHNSRQALGLPPVEAQLCNIQADVPPQNIIATWEALQEYGV